ncbi:hypothetical protein KC318_g6882 [Hortaea werneckii]|uniref:Uncharacterized protein n=1 Tax=Hortaea werneckii TaxID=91943 RepID=A0A3M7A8R5_HORWE|nr:hypothetical protein KC334_g13586 [Hortaea werneckii]KAI7009184.1 hypothetical protein KC355_g6668 [Hortaea werneckii]KAI7665816.1 hypothetical protein KC318_g6882 [Hortaea werneckii]RMY23956.1 hypothetical protein D0867_01695 [Hortaea werneckii]RMY39092.1 hypothetical protein D0866_02152 [Hortaea werneckii]
MKSLIAKASFKLCDEGRTIETKTINYDLYEEDHTTDIELEILERLDANGGSHYPLFHVNSEPCAIQRPIGDLLYIWHTEKIAGSVFCLHLYERYPEDAEVEVQGAGSDDVNDSASQLFVEDGSISPQGCPLANFRLSFGFKLNAPVDGSIWKPRNVAIPLSDKVESIPNQIRDMVQQIVLQDQGLSSALMQRNHRLLCRPILKFNDERRIYAAYSRKVRVDTIADLFPSNGAAARTTPVFVKMKLRPCGDTSDSIEGRVVAHVDFGNEYFRVGSINITNQVSASTQASQKLPSTRALIAHFETDGENETFHLGKVDSWLVNGLEIGECCTSSPAHAETSFALTGPYRGIESMEDLCEMVRYQRGECATASDQGVPIAPVYSWRAFDPREYRLGVFEHVARKVTAAIKCVNLLPKHAGCSNLILPCPTSMQLKRTCTSTATKIQELIEGELGDGNHEDGRTTHLLFESALREKWKLLLWAMPQIEGDALLFKFEQGKLADFIDWDCDEIDCRLYIETHIIPRSFI